MPKDSFWFTHDYNARNDDKILELRSEYGAEGYGIFWMLIETMADSNNGGIKATLIGGLSHGYGIPKATLTGMLKFCIQIGLLYEEGDFYFSKRILKHKTERQFFKEKGKEGSKKRWKTDSPPIPTQMLKTEQNRTEEIHIENNSPKENKFPTYPTESDSDLELPVNYVKKSIEFLDRNKQIKKTEGQICVMWEFFKLQNFTGKKYYSDVSDVYTHFLRTLSNEKPNALAAILNGNNHKRNKL